MITLAGQLAIKTIHGRNGDFNVGHLSTSIGEFVTKNAELDQYREGKYEGDFNIVEIRPSMYTTGGRMVIEMRAVLEGMTLSNIDALTRDEARRLSPQEVDPIDEEAPKPVSSASATPTVEPPPVTEPPNHEASVVEAPASSSTAQPEATAEDANLFGAVWPLGSVVKLDPTVDRRLFRQQRNRLDALGYRFDYTSQNWCLKAA